MILKFLEYIGRKKVVLDRGPSHPEYNKAKKAYKFKDTSKKMEEMKAKVDFSQSK